MFGAAIEVNNTIAKAFSLGPRTITSIVKFVDVSLELSRIFI